MIGSRLGSYEITAKLGEGGMGVVYRAKDFHLGREVALKVLPEGFTQDPERLARFEREAKLLASLNHPNIAHVYGLETSGETRALVMELVDGPTLAERLEQGLLSFNEVLSVSLQIAHALEEAHEKGIVHRDLKPQNIKASIEGKVKVLDFGLAKAMDPTAERAASASQLAQSPTLTLGATVQGVILGTAAYMAPEQAAGGAVDRRADIWSFGVVLYEMLSGRRLFEGETVSHVLAGVLKEEPDYSALPSETPARIRWLVRRCLRKRPRERLQSIGDARLMLEEVLAGGDRDEAAPGATAEAVPMRATSWKLLATAGAALLALGLAAGRVLLAPQVEQANPVRLELAIPEGWSLQWGVGQAGIALSPDGRRLALAVRGEAESRSGLLVRDLGELEPRLLAGTEGARMPFFSPDGEWIAYSTDRELSKVAVAGGRPIRLAEVQRQSRGGVWGSDGYLYFSVDSEEPISRVAESGGAVEAVTTLDTARQERTHRWPELSADGRWLLFATATTASPNSMRDARVEAVRLATGERHVLFEGASHARLLADDVLIYLQAGSLFALAVDPERLAPRGKPVALEQEVAANLGTGALWFAPSRRGSAVWIPGVPSREGSTPTWLTLDGKSSPISIPETQGIYQLEPAPDGRRAALTVGASGMQGTRGADIWIADFERGTLTRLSFGENGSNPTWTPDGQRIAYRTLSVEAGAEKFGVVWRPADGSGEAEVLLPPQVEPLHPNSFSPDGRLLSLVRFPRGTGDLWLLPLDPPAAPRPFLATPFGEYDPSISPDGRWIAYVSDETGNNELYVRPFPAGPGKWQLSSAGAFEPHWSADGRTLFFRASGGRLMRVGIEPGAVFRASAPESLVGGFQSGPGSKTYGIDPDGQRFLTLPLVRAGQNLRAVAYSDDWLVRARRLLAPPK